jgi:hypothetical protein
MHLSTLCCAAFRDVTSFLPFPSSIRTQSSEAGEYDERKFQKLQEKTDYVRREFNLPDTEDVIQGARSCRTSCHYFYHFNYLVN